MPRNKHSHYVHQKTFSIAWGDMDALGHVNNVRYFEYFQQARLEWLESLGLGMHQTVGPVVVHVACTFLKPITYPAHLNICSSILNVGNSSATLSHEIFQADTLMATGNTKAVWFDYMNKISVPLPEIIRRIFEKQQSAT